MTVPVTELHPSTCGNKTLIPNYERQPATPDRYVINTNQPYNNQPEGSIFVPNLREVCPFEAYATTMNAPVKDYIPLIDEIASGIYPTLMIDNKADIYYDLSGRKVTRLHTRGVYLTKGRKLLKK